MSELSLHKFTAQYLKLNAACVDDFVRLTRRCLPAGECWEWQGSRNEKGYGKFWPTGYRQGASAMYVHRFTAMAIGLDITGRLVCHRCDNPPCCNPDHLFIGSHTDNAQDAIAKGRYKKPPVMDWPAWLKENRHPQQRLAREDIPKIRDRLAEGATLSAVAAEFGVSFQSISKIKLGQRWAHV